jgi:L-asparaginase II
VSDATAAPALLAEVTRGGHGGGARVESSHHGHVVVVGPDGGVARSLGDADRVTFVRSTVKPFQATACLEILDGHGDGRDHGRDHEVGTAADALPVAEAAVAQASHRGEPRQLDTVRALLRRSGTADEAVTTPPARPEAQPGLGEARLHHNCSGKHAMFALAGAALDCPRDRLLDPDGPLQRRVLDVLAEALGPAVAVGVDGCGAPAVAVPLVGLARAFRRLRAEDRWARVRQAALAEPGLVGGSGRLDSDLLAAGVSAKAGAEGVYGAGWTDRDGYAWGVAVKCEDGAARGAEAALWGLLTEAGVVADDVHRVAPPQGGGRPVGEVRPAAPVRDAARTLGAGAVVSGPRRPLVP